MFLANDATYWAKVGAWAAIVYDVLTLLLFIAAAVTAGVALYQLRHLRRESTKAAEASQLQLKAIQDQVALATESVAQARESSDRQLTAMERARRSGAAPLVVPIGLRFTRFGDSGYLVDVAIQNIGFGPAIHVEAACWFLGVDEADLPDISKMDQHTTRLVEAMREPPAPGASYALGAGAKEVLGIGGPGAVTRAVVDSDQLIVAVKLQFHDLHCDNPYACRSPFSYPLAEHMPEVLFAGWPKDL